RPAGKVSGARGRSPTGASGSPGGHGSISPSSPRMSVTRGIAAVLDTDSSCPAKAGHPVNTSVSVLFDTPGSLDRPLSRTMTVDGWGEGDEEVSASFVSNKRCV